MQVKNYKIVKLLKRTSKWDLHLAKHIDDKFFVRIRVFNPTLTSNEVARNKLFKALEYFYLIRNKHLISILDFGYLDKSTIYEVIEHLDYINLRELINKARRIPQEIAAIILYEVLNGLSQAHARGIFHGYINPYALVTSTTGIIKIQDFAYADNDLSFNYFICADSLNTNLYYSPEHILQKPLDKRTDFFLLGIIAYEMLAGKHPFWSSERPWDIHKIITDNQEPVFYHLHYVHPTMERIVEKMLQKNPADRYQDAESILAEINPYIQSFGDYKPYEILSAYFIDPRLSTQQIEEGFISDYYETARNHFYSKNYNKALFMFQVINLQEKKPEGLSVYLNDCMEKKGFLPQNESIRKLIDEYNFKLSNEPRNPAILIKLAQLHREIGNYVDSVYYSKKLLQIDNTNKEALENIGDFVKIETDKYEVQSHFSNALAQPSYQEITRDDIEFPLYKKLLIAVIMLGIIIAFMSYYKWLDFPSIISNAAASGYNAADNQTVANELKKAKGMLNSTNNMGYIQNIQNELIRTSGLNLSQGNLCDVNILIAWSYIKLSDSIEAKEYIDKAKNQCQDFVKLKDVYINYGLLLESKNVFSEALDAYLELMLNLNSQDKDYAKLQDKVKALQKQILLTMSPPSTPQ